MCTSETVRCTYLYHIHLYISKDGQFYIDTLHSAMVSDKKMKIILLSRIFKRRVRTT